MSANYRLFKINDLQSGFENYGQSAIPQGSIANHSNVFHLDANCIFPGGQVIPVCGNTHRILAGSRFSKFCKLTGNQKSHYGEFPRSGPEDLFEMAYGETATPSSETNKSTWC